MTALAGVLGWPVGHSRSPAMHNAAFRELGLGWSYGLLPVPPELFEETARALPGSGYRGANVTIPHKEAAARIHAASPVVRAIGAANTLSFTDGEASAHNTDAAGLIDALPERPEGKRALVLGAGGAARAAVWALLDAGAAEVAVWNRTRERAEEIARALGATAVASPVGADLIVNATSIGLAREDSLDDLLRAGLSPAPLIVDLVYGAGPTPFARWAGTVGAEFVDGIEVLVRQGALSFELWTGREAPLEVMRAAARNG